MFCPKCGNNVKDGARFCGSCGWAVPNAPVQKAEPVGERCASCGTVLKEGARFCPKCGEAVSPNVIILPAPVATAPPSADDAASEEAKADMPAPETGGRKSGAIDKAVFCRLGSRIYACYLYKDGAVVGSITDTQGAFIADVKEWLENNYDNLLVEAK